MEDYVYYASLLITIYELDGDVKYIEKAKDILSLNNEHGRAVIEARNQQIDAMTKSEGPMSFKELNDVKMDRHMNATQSGINAVRRR